MEDNEIIALYWERDETAIAETDRKYHPYCSTIAYQILRDRRDSEECVNDTWLRVWGTIPPQRPGILSAFLGRITRNLSLDRYRAETAQKRGGHLEELDLELNQVSGKDPIADLLDADQLAQIISAFLRECSQSSRVIFLRRYWYLDSIRQIAERYQVSESQVKTSLHRTRSRLRLRLEQEGVSLR